MKYVIATLVIVGIMVFAVAVVKAQEPILDISGQHFCLTLTHANAVFDVEEAMGHKRARTLFNDYARKGICDRLAKGSIGVIVAIHRTIQCAKCSQGVLSLVETKHPRTGFVVYLITPTNFTANIESSQPVDFRAKCMTSRMIGVYLSRTGYTLDKQIIEDERMAVLAALVNASHPVSAHVPNWIVVSWHEEGHVAVGLMKDDCSLALMAFGVGDDANRIRGVLERDYT